MSCTILKIAKKHPYHKDKIDAPTASTWRQEQARRQRISWERIDCWLLQINVAGIMIEYDRRREEKNNGCCLFVVFNVPARCGSGVKRILGQKSWSWFDFLSTINKWAQNSAKLEAQSRNEGVTSVRITVFQLDSHTKLLANVRHDKTSYYSSSRNDLIFNLCFY